MARPPWGGRILLDPDLQNRRVTHQNGIEREALAVVRERSRISVKARTPSAGGGFAKTYPATAI